MFKIGITLLMMTGILAGCTTTANQSGDNDKKTITNLDEFIEQNTDLSSNINEFNSDKEKIGQYLKRVLFKANRYGFLDYEFEDHHLVSTILIRPEDVIEDWSDKVCSKANGVVDGNVCVGKDGHSPLFIVIRQPTGLNENSLTFIYPKDGQTIESKQWINYVTANFGFKSKPETIRRFNVSESNGSLSAFGFLFGKTKLEDLPVRCFNSHSVVRANSFGMYKDEDPMVRYKPRRTLLGSPVAGEVGIYARQDRILECFGDKIKDLYLVFSDDKLSRIDFTRERSVNGLKLETKGVKNIKCKKTDQESVACAKGRYVISSTNDVDFDNQKIEHVRIVDRLPQDKAFQYLSSNGYPSYGPFKLGLSTKKDLNELMTNLNFKQYDRWDQFENAYKSVLNIFRLDGSVIKNYPVLYKLIFDKKDILKEVVVTFDPNSLPITDEVERFIFPPFEYQGKTNSMLVNFNDISKRIDDNVYWHSKYLPEKTGGIALFAAHVRVIRGTNKVESIKFVNPLFNPM